MSVTQPPLLRLRIAAGWLVRYNELREIAPEKLLADDELWVYMNQDLMQVESRDETMLIDVGWYPDNDPSGHFGIKVVVEEDWERPIVSTQASTLRELIDRLEALLARPPLIPTERLVERLIGGVAERRCAAAEALAQRGAIDAIDAISVAMTVESIGAAYDRLSAARKRLIERCVWEQPSGKTLIRIGFFRELRHGQPTGPSLKEALAPAVGIHDDAVVEYLKSGVALMVAPGIVRDVLAPESGPIGSLSILTDGVYAWPSDLAHYVARYHARVPVEFVEHAADHGWQIPPVDPTTLKLG